MPVRQGYQRWAEVYDGDGNPLVAMDEQHFSAMLPDVSGRLIADLGCGTGRHTARLAVRGATVVALDFSCAMIKRARTRARSARASWIMADVAGFLPLKNNVLDGVVCSLVIEHVRDIAAMLVEVRRVCKPGAFALISDIHPEMAAGGAAASFRDPRSGLKVFPRGYRHELADYLAAAAGAGFRIEAISEPVADRQAAARAPRARKHVGKKILLMLRLTAL